MATKAVLLCCVFVVLISVVFAAPNCTTPQYECHTCLKSTSKTKQCKATPSAFVHGKGRLDLTESNKYWCLADDGSKICPSNKPLYVFSDKQIRFFAEHEGFQEGPNWKTLALLESTIKLDYWATSLVVINEHGTASKNSEPKILVTKAKVYGQNTRYVGDVVKSSSFNIVNKAHKDRKKGVKYTKGTGNSQELCVRENDDNDKPDSGVFYRYVCQDKSKPKGPKKIYYAVKSRVSKGKPSPRFAQLEELKFTTNKYFKKFKGIAYNFDYIQILKDTRNRFSGLRIVLVESCNGNFVEDVLDGLAGAIDSGAAKFGKKLGLAKKLEKNRKISKKKHKKLRQRTSQKSVGQDSRYYHYTELDWKKVRKNLDKNIDLLFHTTVGTHGHDNFLSLLTGEDLKNIQVAVKTWQLRQNEKEHKADVYWKCFGSTKDCKSVMRPKPK